MGKRKRYKGKSHIKKTPQRESIGITKDSSLLRRKPHKPFNIKLDEIEDRRRLKRNPLTTLAKPAMIGYAVKREIRSQVGTLHRKKRGVIPRIKPYSIRYRVQRRFLDSNRTVVCWRRKIRRAVLFAKGKTGKGSRNPNRRRNENSNIVCRRG